MTDGSGGSLLLRGSVTARLLEILPERSRRTAERVLLLAVKARNALAHGAVRTFTAEMLEGAGHLVVKSMHLLVAGDQIVILENDEPPQSIHDEINYVHFSGERTVGRFGFYLPLPF